MLEIARLFIAGEWVDGDTSIEINDKYTGLAATQVHIASVRQVSASTRAVAAGHERIALRPYERFVILSRASQLLSERHEFFSQTIVDDSGLTITDARREVSRAVQTLLLCGEEAKRIAGEVVPVNSGPDAIDRICLTTRHPVGVVCAITPFNSPLNTVAHKVGPAIAAGNAVVLKPATHTPLTANRFVELLLEAGLPEDLIALVHGPGSTVGRWLVQDPVPAFYAFTGSTSVGEYIRREVGLRRAQLELGSLSSTIVCEDANIETASQLCLNAAFRKAGQVCTSVQRLYVQQDAIPSFVSALTSELDKRSTGDPHRDDTFVGPLVTLTEAERVSNWVDDAVGKGASVIYGGGRSGPIVEPTIILDAASDMYVMSEEIFGPVVCIQPFAALEDAIAGANDTPFGLACGIFTSDLDCALTAAERLRFGAVHINETSSSRVDLMPYGGVKRSGMGREGPRYAIEEMTEERVVSIGRSQRKRSPGS